MLRDNFYRVGRRTGLQSQVAVCRSANVNVYLAQHTRRKASPFNFYRVDAWDQICNDVSSSGRGHGNGGDVGRIVRDRHAGISNHGATGICDGARNAA